MIATPAAPSDGKVRNANAEPRLPESRPRTGEALLRLENVSKVFYTDEIETHALSSIELEIKDGEYVSIAGPSGCGKSTLLSILGLLDSPTGGRYWLKGK